MAVKTWFITGTSRGFGREWAIVALDRGDEVAATARDIAGLDDLVAKYGKTILPIRLDVTSSDTGGGPRMVLGGRRLDSLAARAAEGWRAGLAGRLTVQVLPPEHGAPNPALAQETAAAPPQATRSRTCPACSGRKEESRALPC